MCACGGGESDEGSRGCDTFSGWGTSVRIMIVSCTALDLLYDSRKALCTSGSAFPRTFTSVV